MEPEVLLWARVLAQLLWVFCGRLKRPGDGVPRVKLLSILAGSCIEKHALSKTKQNKKDSLSGGTRTVLLFVRYMFII